MLNFPKIKAWPPHRTISRYAPVPKPMAAFIYFYFVIPLCSTENCKGEPTSQQTPDIKKMFFERLKNPTNRPKTFLKCFF